MKAKKVIFFYIEGGSQHGHQIDGPCRREPDGLLTGLLLQAELARQQAEVRERESVGRKGRRGKEGGEWRRKGEAC